MAADEPSRCRCVSQGMQCHLWETGLLERCLVPVEHGLPTRRDRPPNRPEDAKSLATQGFPEVRRRRLEPDRKSVV